MLFSSFNAKHTYECVCTYRCYIEYLIPNCFNFFQSIKKPFFCCFPSKIEGREKVAVYSKLACINILKIFKLSPYNKNKVNFRN